MTGWREARRRSARDAIVEAAWALVGERGPSRTVAARPGPPGRDHHTDGVCLFRLEERDIRCHVRPGRPRSSPSGWPNRTTATTRARFSRPGLGGSSSSAPAIRRATNCCSSARSPDSSHRRVVRAGRPCLGDARELLGSNGITEARHLDMWTALVTGLVDQQVSNDPGGTAGSASSTSRSTCSSPIASPAVPPRARDPHHPSRRSPSMTVDGHRCARPSNR